MSIKYLDILSTKVYRQEYIFNLMFILTAFGVGIKVLKPDYEKQNSKVILYIFY